MEEKDRYEWGYSSKTMEDCMFDNLTKIKIYCENIPNLLNQQDKRIKELEQQTYPAYKREHQRRAYLENIEVPKLEQENQQLKQSLNSKAIEVLEKIVNLFEPYENDCKDTILCANNGISFIEYIDDQIKELKSKNEM